MFVQSNQFNWRWVRFFAICVALLQSFLPISHFNRIAGESFTASISVSVLVMSVFLIGSLLIWMSIKVAFLKTEISTHSGLDKIWLNLNRYQHTIRTSNTGLLYAWSFLLGQLYNAISQQNFLSHQEVLVTVAASVFLVVGLFIVDFLDNIVEMFDPKNYLRQIPIDPEKAFRREKVMPYLILVMGLVLVIFSVAIAITVFRN
jgi:hypothetical protein